MSLFKQVLLCLVIIAIGAVGWYVYQNPSMVGLARETAGGDGEAALRGAPGRIPGVIADGAVNVVTAPVETDQGGETIRAVGTAEAIRSVTVFPQVTGIVSEVAFTPGEPVEAGAVLVRLEDAEQAVAVDRARVALEQAEAAVERSQTLAQSQTISEVALSDAQATAELAGIELRAAEIALQRRTITAPFGGTTGLSDVSIGDLLSTTTPITTLDDLSTLRVDFEIPERWVGRVRQGMPITATAQGLPGTEFAGEVRAIDNRVDPTTRTLRLEAALSNEGEVLKPGMALTVALDHDTDEQLAVPSLALQWDRDGSFVWKIEDQAARRAPVVILSRESGLVIVQSEEIAAGDAVVVEGVQRLRDGALVAEVDVTPTIVGEPGDGFESDRDAGGAPAVSGTATSGRTRS